MALFSTEAEYVSFTEGAKEAIYLRCILIELKLNDWTDITIFTDNREAQFITNDQLFHARTINKAIAPYKTGNFLNGFGLKRTVL